MTDYIAPPDPNRKYHLLHIPTDYPIPWQIHVDPPHGQGTLGEFSYIAGFGTEEAARNYAAMTQTHLEDGNGPGGEEGGSGEPAMG